MYVGVDVGGTKTLVAVLDDHGVIQQSRKFPTPTDYKQFLLELRHAAAHLEHHDFVAGGIGAPGTIDRRHGIGRKFANLPWQNVHILADVERIFGCPMVVENDAKLAGLSESMLLKNHHRVLYVTISTGIGYALVVDGNIETNFSDNGAADIFLEHEGKLAPWESFASGRAIVARYGKRAEDIHDDATWQKIVRELRSGFLQLIAIMEPDAIVVGGSVGNFFERFEKFLKADLKAYETPLLHIPPLYKAQRPEEAVIFGCYDLAKATFKAPAAKKKKKHAKTT
jgi:predicted NBD/HSP70 family sugar kinase